MQKPNVVEMKFTRKTALAKVRAAAANSANVILGNHAKERMEERDITNMDVLRVLRNGHLEEGPSRTERGDYKVKMTLKIRGSREAGVVTIILKDDRLFVATVEWEDVS